MSEVTLHDDTAHGHHPFLQHHFEDLGQQHEASTLGMWFFLTTEILFFGGVLMAYWVYRITYPHAWSIAGTLQNTLFGGINTLVLIVSSFTMAMAVRCAQINAQKLLIVFLILTLIFGCTFLGIKSKEYYDHWHEGLFPGDHFTWNEHPDVAPKVELFMCFYWGMTGLHALHMVIGAGLLLWIIWRAARRHFGPEYYGPVEVMGLYWHFVDIVWIFLFPFLYLIPKHTP